MDPSDKRRVTRNLVLIKERLEEDLDGVVDILIQDDIFTIQIKEEIDGATPPTPQKKSTVFVNKLLKSGPRAFGCFCRILADRGYHDLLEVMTQKDNVSLVDGASSWSEERSKTFVVPSAEPGGITASTTDDNIGPEPLDRVMTFVMSKFEQKETEIKNELRKEFEDRLSEDKRQHEATIQQLQKDLSRLAKISEEYEHLKTIQKTLRKQLSEQHEKMSALNRENVSLKKDSSRVETLTDENMQLKAENEKLKQVNSTMEHEVRTLKDKVSKKEQEINSLRMYIDKQYHKLRSDLTKSSEKMESEQGSLHAGLQKQQGILSEISKAVQLITRDMGIADLEENSPNTPRIKNQSRAKSRTRPFMPGKINPRSSYNKYVGNKGK